MSTIVTRAGKGAPLTHNEVDANFTNLNADKYQAGDDATFANVSLGDGGKAIFGAGSDLQIYHDGLNSYIDDAGTGNLQVRGNNLYLQKYTGENYIRALADGAVDLYHNGSSKLATTSTGVSVTGTVAATAFTGDGSGLTGLPAGYTNSDVDAHLNTSTATSSQVLSWSGTDYDWVDAGGAGAVGGGTDAIFWENDQTVTTSYTITNGKNAMSAGPITIASGVTVTVGAGEVWTVV